MMTVPLKTCTRSLSPFDDTRVHIDRITDLELGGGFLEGGLLDGFDDTVDHGGTPIRDE
jgi:hypothetical protein